MLHFQYMEKQPAGRINNLVFTVTVVLAALGVYLLLGSGAAGQRNPQTDPDAASTPEPERPLVFQPVPEDVYAMLLTSGEGYLAAQSKRDARRYGVQCGPAQTGGAKLVYTVDESGFVSSVTLTFPCPEPPPEKPKTAVERQLVNAHAQYVAAQNEAVKTILFAAFGANDLNDVLLEPVLLKWYSEALRARDEERTYSDAYRGCTFQTYPAALGGARVFIASLMTEE